MGRVNGLSTKITKLLLTGMILLLGCQSSEVAEQRQNLPEKRATGTGPTYQIGKVSQKPVMQDIQLPGEFKAYQEVSLYPKANGFVEKVLVDRGTAVKKGQLLMVLDAPEVEEQLIAARSKFLKAEAVFVGSKDNYRRLLSSSKTPGAVSALDLEMAQARMMSDSAAVMGERANYRALEKIKSYMRVTAPFNGVITERNVHPGALVGPGMKYDQPMLVLQEQSRLRLLMDVPETYSLKVKQGRRVHFTVNAVPGKTFEGTISRMSGSMNRRFRSETVEIDIDNTTNQFKPGMFAEIRLAAESTPDALVVPETAVVTSTERQYIIKVQGRKAQFVEVKKGNQAEGLIEVFGDLQSDDQVVVNASTEIKDGADLGI